MFVAMSAMLVSIAELSNVLSVLAVLICFCAMFLLIMRNMTVFWLHGEDFMFSGSVHHVQPKIPQMKMMKVHIPFTCKVSETNVSPKRGVKCKIASQVPYRLEAYWGVSIRELHLFLWRPWSDIKQAIQRDSLLIGHYQQKGHSILETSSHTEKTITMMLPEGCLELGAPPRLRYPLVILLIRSTPPGTHVDEAVALISVVHIKDNICTLPTNILAQYLKQANGQLSSLKQLYLATGNANYDDSVDQPREDKEEEEESRILVDALGRDQLCVVCQFQPLSRALLPCRHTCICASCFAKLDTCPMCRSPIKSYFCVRSEEYLSDENSEKTLPTQAKPAQRLSHWLLGALAEKFGLHR